MKQERKIRKLRGARILIAEDNRINQLVIRTLMEHMGITAEIAGTGKEALEAVKQSDFDLILMDIQMPEMDGYEAARAIREFEKRAKPVSGFPLSASGHRIPIIAMTAHMMSEERQKCLEAGIDDYLNKSANPDQIFAVLKNHIKTAESASPDSEIFLSRPFRHETASRNPEPDLPGIDTDFGIRHLSGNAGLYRKLLLAFSTDYADAVSGIREYLEKGDTQQAGQRLHAIKGVAATMGASDLHRKTAELEAFIYEHRGRKIMETEAYEQTEAQFAASLHQVMESVNRLRAITDSQAGTAEEDEQNRDLTENTTESENMLKEFADFLRYGDSEAAESLKKLRPCLSTPDTEELLARLEAEIFDFDFDKAEKLFEKIMKILNMNQSRAGEAQA